MIGKGSQPTIISLYVITNGLSKTTLLGFGFECLNCFCFCSCYNAL